MPGYPGGSVVGFAPDQNCRPILVLSGMSSHTMDMLADPRCSLTIADKNFKGAADGRVNLIGTCHRLKDKEEIGTVNEMYPQKHSFAPSNSSARPKG
jgi:heme iron utilization protein